METETIFPLILVMVLGFSIYSFAGLPEESVCSVSEDFEKDMKLDTYDPEEPGINSHGLRDEEFSREKPGDELRVLVVGAGFVYQHRLNKTQRFTEKAENKLDEEIDSNVNVVNAGIRGSGMEDYYRYFYNEGVKLEPDVLVVAFTSRDERSYGERVSATERVVERYDLKDAESIQDNPVADEEYSQDLNRIVVEGLESEDSDIITYGNMIQRVADGNGIETLFYLIEPEVEDRGLWNLEEGLEIGDRRYSSLIEAWTAECDIELYTAPEELEEGKVDLHSESDYTLDGGDFSEAGNEVLAEKLYRILVVSLDVERSN